MLTIWPNRFPDISLESQTNGYIDEDDVKEMNVVI
jgi:hypothetical protein